MPTPRALPDTTICIGSSVQLNAHDGRNYTWSPVINIDNVNSASPIVSPLSDTKYYVTVINNFQCANEDSVIIKVDKKVDIKTSSNITICTGTKTQLFVSGNTQHFEWSPEVGLDNAATFNPVASPTVTTSYQVIGYRANVCGNDTGFVLITVKDLPHVNLGADTTVTAGTQVTLNAMAGNDVVTYTWQPSVGLSCTSCAVPQFIADKNISYIVNVQTAAHCGASDTINITVLCGKQAVYIPSAFTPNGDGKNDVFYIMGYGVSNIKSFKIFDRWGNKVFSRNNISANDRSNGWNGLIKGEPVAVGTTFVYVADVECNEGNTLQLKGTVVLIR